MIDKDVLELLNMYTAAAQLAKSRNKYEYHEKMNEVVLTELLKKAFPALRNDINVMILAKSILNNHR